MSNLKEFQHSRADGYEVTTGLMTFDFGKVNK